MNGLVSVDDLVSRLNPTQEADLALLLSITVPRRRVATALAWVGWTQSRWCVEAGLEEVTVGRWMNHHNRMPLGGGLRLARVIGADPFQLFAAHLDAP